MSLYLELKVNSTVETEAIMTCTRRFSIFNFDKTFIDIINGPQYII